MGIYKTIVKYREGEIIKIDKYEYIYHSGELIELPSLIQKTTDKILSLITHDLTTVVYYCKLEENRYKLHNKLFSYNYDGEGEDIYEWVSDRYHEGCIFLLTEDDSYNRKW